MDVAKEARRKAAASAPREPLRHASAPPVPPSTPAAGPTSAQAGPEATTMLVGSGPKRSAPPPQQHRRRRWPLFVAAALVLSAGAAGGVLAQRVYGAGTAEAGEDEATDDETADETDDSTDDHATAPTLPDRFQPQSPDPRDKSAIADPLRQFFADPSDPADPDPAPLPPARQQPRLRRGGVPDVENFGSALATSLCEKLTTCGVFDGLGGGLGGSDMCSLVASSFQDPDTAERVRRGECHYDAAAAGQCLDALGDLKCDATTDPSSLLAFADQMDSCTSALRCD